MNGIDLIFILKKMNLKSLDLQYNKITDFSPLQTHYNLHSLNLAYNGAKNVKDFINCSELQNLVLNMNQINDCSGLEQLINLQILNLGYNQFKNIYPIQNLVNLTWLDLQCNRFEDFSPLAQLVKLETLFQVEAHECIQFILQIYLQGVQFILIKIYFHFSYPYGCFYSIAKLAISASQQNQLILKH
ncbi:leucine-rich_repeat domain-containing protein [Hexamita inflata]|uniref:Leucine-rich repeat domain-containing protein n=1 Tax=Hexamita inflata TaxID=28002 RepID=A0AA86QYV0_9EUKA|nr:leucine-rich repeat domain-containing protein [Hexamita inflata]